MTKSIETAEVEARWEQFWIDRKLSFSHGQIRLIPPILS